MKLLSLILALTCNTVEPIEAYHKMKVEDQKTGLSRHETFGFMDDRCHRIGRGTAVEVLEKNDYLLKLRYFEPKEPIYDAQGHIAGQGVTHEAYADASEFAANMPAPDVPRPSAKLLEQRRRIKEVKDKWGIPGDTVYIGD